MFGEHFTARHGQPAGGRQDRPGASGIVAIEAMVRAPADAHTILFGSTGMFFQARVLNRKLAYDLDRVHRADRGLSDGSAGACGHRALGDPRLPGDARPRATPAHDDGQPRDRKA
jgi:hypothetical protein